MTCRACGQRLGACICDRRVLWKNAVIDSVPVEGNPAARTEIEDALRRLDIIAADERLESYREEAPFERKGGESFGAAFTVTVTTASGRTEHRSVYAKAIVSPFPEERARLETGRLRQLKSWGIRVPRLYGWSRGTIYMEFLPGNRDRLLADLQDGCTTRPDRYVRLDELARFAAILDFHGATPLDFVLDLAVDAIGHWCYVDAGFDLGDVPAAAAPNPTKPALASLACHFHGRTLAFLGLRYRHWFNRLVQADELSIQKGATHVAKDPGPHQA